MHEESLSAKCGKKVVQVTLYIPFQRIVFFPPQQTESCRLFLVCIQSALRRYLYIDKVIHVFCKGLTYWPRLCRDRETHSMSFPLQHFRDGRDYGRITLHNMAAPNQIKAKTIKARVKATAVSSFKCLPPPPQLSKSVTLNSTVSIPNLSTSGIDISPFCMNTGQ